MAHQSVAWELAVAGPPYRPGIEGRELLSSGLVRCPMFGRPYSRAPSASRWAAVTYCLMVRGPLYLPLYGSQSWKPLIDAPKWSVIVTSPAGGMEAVAVTRVRVVRSGLPAYAVL